MLRMCSALLVVIALSGLLGENASAAEYTPTTTFSEVISKQELASAFCLFCWAMPIFDRFGFWVRNTWRDLFESDLPSGTITDPEVRYDIPNKDAIPDAIGTKK